jgi:hypothetical protein
LLSKLFARLKGGSGRVRTRTVETPEGTVTLRKQNVTPVPQTITLLDAREIEHIRELDKAASHFLASYQPGASPSLKAFDEAFSRWQRETGPRFPDEVVIAQLGARLGSTLAAEFDMEWVLVEDEYGADTAVRCRRYDVMSFPFASVAKRIHNHQHAFMYGVYVGVRDMIASGPKVRDDDATGG